MSVKFGDKLKQARKNKNMTQGQLGEAIGFKGGTISAWENGTSEPSLKTIPLLCAILGVEVNFLLESITMLDNEKSYQENVDEMVYLMTVKGGAYGQLAKGAQARGLEFDADEMNTFLDFWQKSQERRKQP
jgi:transcriptional regulator with XRE-family HTH domain